MMKEVIYLAAEWYDSVGHTDGLKGLNEIIDPKMKFLLYIQPHAVPNIHNMFSLIFIFLMFWPITEKVTKVMKLLSN